MAARDRRVRESGGRTARAAAQVSRGHFVALLAALAAAALPQVVLAAEPQHVVRIGFASPLTGPQAHYGRDNRNGAQMAIDELNAQPLTIGGRAVRFELLAEDDQADPKTGTIVAQRLVDAGIRGMV